MDQERKEQPHTLYEFSMKPTKNLSFEQFYDWCFKNRHTTWLSQYYFSIYKNKIGIPAGKIIHSFEEHQTNIQQWKKFIGNEDKCILVSRAKKPRDFDNPIYLMLYEIDDKYYGCALAQCKKRWYVGTWFEGTKKGIIGWLKDKGESEPQVPTATNVPGFPLKLESPNNIIKQDKEKVNPNLNKSESILDDNDEQKHRLRNREKSDASKLAWKRNHASYMRGIRKREREDMKKTRTLLDICKEMKLDEAELSRDNVFQNELNIDLQNIAGGISLKINKENGNVSISTSLEQSGSGQYRLTNYDEESLKNLYNALKDDLMQLCENFDDEIEGLLSKHGLKSTK